MEKKNEYQLVDLTESQIIEIDGGVILPILGIWIVSKILE